VKHPSWHQICHLEPSVLSTVVAGYPQRSGRTLLPMSDGHCWFQQITAATWAKAIAEMYVTYLFRLHSQVKVWLVALHDVEESKLAHTEYFLFLLHHLHCQCSRFIPCMLCRRGGVLNSHRSYALIPAPAGALVREQSAVEDLPATAPAKHNRLRLNLTSELSLTLT